MPGHQMLINFTTYSNNLWLSWDLGQIATITGFFGLQWHLGCLEEKFWPNLVENCSSSLWRRSHHPLSFNNYRLNSNYMLLMPLMLNWFLSNHHPPKTHHLQAEATTQLSKGAIISQLPKSLKNFWVLHIRPELYTFG